MATQAASVETTEDPSSMVYYGGSNGNYLICVRNDCVFRREDFSGMCMTSREETSFGCLLFAVKIYLINGCSLMSAEMDSHSAIQLMKDIAVHI